jgi:hypothetical protein
MNPRATKPGGLRSSGSDRFSVVHVTRRRTITPGPEEIASRPWWWGFLRVAGVPESVLAEYWDSSRSRRLTPRLFQFQSMDPWRDYPNFTDGALDAFIKRFPSHPDHPAAVAEFQRRREDREQRREAKNNQPGAAALLLGKGIPAWARVAIIVASIAFVLAALCLGFQLFSLGTQRGKPPTAPPASSPKTAAPVSGSLPPSEKVGN